MTDLRFRTLGRWLEDHFGSPTYRVALDAGSTCPNRDGEKGFGGCVYCDVEGSGTGALRTGHDLEEQLKRGLNRVSRRQQHADGEHGVIAYFQSYSNTYVEAQRLEEVLGVVRPHLGAPVVAVSVATRPDTLTEECLDVLSALTERVEVWLELGLEAADDMILTKIGRMHTVDEFREATTRAAERGIGVVGHAILGLPGDGLDGAQKTADVLAECGVWGVKVHHLMVLRRTILEGWWRQGDVDLLEPERYVEWLADFVERLHPEQVLHRVTGESPKEKLLAPQWEVSKNAVRAMLTRALQERDTRQGSRCLTETAPFFTSGLRT
jgi:radical SAM protein (TIGR01212 family)